MVLNVMSATYSNEKVRLVRVECDALDGTLCALERRLSLML